MLNLPRGKWGKDTTTQSRALQLPLAHLNNKEPGAGIPRQDIELSPELKFPILR